jgi:hypothetical protein
MLVRMTCGFRSVFATVFVHRRLMGVAGLWGLSSPAAALILSASLRRSA